MCQIFNSPLRSRSIRQLLESFTEILPSLVHAPMFILQFTIRALKSPTEFTSDLLDFYLYHPFPVTAIATPRFHSFPPQGSHRWNAPNDDIDIFQIHERIRIKETFLLQNVPERFNAFPALSPLPLFRFLFLRLPRLTFSSLLSSSSESPY